MAINSNSEETSAAAKQPAELTGESLTAAITAAVRERLDRIHGAQVAGLADLLLQIGRDCAAHLQEPLRSVDHGDFLYDEKGLPRTDLTSTI